MTLGHTALACLLCSDQTLKLEHRRPAHSACAFTVCLQDGGTCMCAHSFFFYKYLCKGSTKVWNKSVNVKTSKTKEKFAPVRCENVIIPLTIITKISDFVSKFWFKVKQQKHLQYLIRIFLL